MREWRKSERRWFWSAAAASLMLVSVGVGCDGEGPERTERPQVREFSLVPAADCDDVRDQVASAYTESALNWLYQEYYWFDDDLAMPEGEMDGAEPPSAGEGGGRSDSPSEYTDTNVQEAGVDEPDLVKTDGTHIYMIANNSLQVLTSWPPEETARVGQYDFPSNVYPSTLFLKDEMVAVFSSIWGGYYDDGGGRDAPGIEPGLDVDSDDGDAGVDGEDWSDEDEVRPGGGTTDFSGTRITLLDVSDRANPVVVRQLDVEGNYLSARMIGSRAYLVTTSGLREANIWSLFEGAEEIEGLPERDENTSSEELEAMRDEARPLLYAFLRGGLDELEVEEMMPRRRIVDQDNEVVLSDVLYSCTDLYIPQVKAELGLLNISQFEMDRSTSLESTGLLAAGWQIYASQQNLYIAMSSRSWWWGWWGGERQNEAHIHKFRLGGEVPEYRASGRVDGWILNQFSFSEHNGYLRVATTDNRWEHNPVTGEFEDQGGNHVIVLEEEEGLLVETGSVRDLAPTERVYSARFMGDRGYVVTFRETDPFYTLDLSDPYDPKMVGELKIEGFSSYMHPLDENHLLAIGREGDENGFMTGVHLQVFDVSDMSEPVRTQHYVISTGGWSSDSEAMWNHLAFTYQPRLGVLAVPMNIWDNDDQFSGLMLFDATKDGIEEIGRIEHGDLAAQDWCLRYGQDSSCEPEHYWQWWTSMRRSIMMSGDTADQEYIYSISSVGLKVNKTFEVDQELASLLWRD